LTMDATKIAFALVETMYMWGYRPTP
jgi:hypothetical protein